MPYLGDFVGLLMAELARAKAQADAESVRIAELYESDELLRHMPIPFIDLPEVKASIPVVLREPEGEGEAEPGHDVGADEIVATFHPNAVEILSASGLTLGRRRVSALKTIIRERAKEVTSTGRWSVPDLAEGLSASVLAVLTERELAGLSDGDRRALHKELTTAVREAALARQRPSRRLEVGLTPEAIADAGDAVVRLELQLSEDRFEWTTIDGEDWPRHRLVRE